MSKVSKIPSRIERYFILKLEYINSNWYKTAYKKWLIRQGVKIKGTPNYISNLAYIDGSRYDYIELGNGCTISRDVLILTHDYSKHTVFNGLKGELSSKVFQILSEGDNKNSLLEQKPIHIGDYSFIGARACLLPGTNIGNNCIIGAGSVVKGKIPDNSIVIGNPAKIYKKTNEWLESKAFHK